MLNPHPAAFREAACARPAALGSLASQSIWRAPAGTIPSAAAVQAHTHPCGPSSRSSPTMLPSRAASLAERFRTLLPLIPHVANATMAQPQVRSASLQSQAPQRKQQQLRVRSRPSPPLRSYPVRPQRTRSRVPMTRRFLHNAPWLSSVSRCLGPTQRRDPVSSSIGGQPYQLIAQSRPITASSTDSDLRRRFAVNGKELATVMVVTVEQAFAHCPKALVRSDLWKAASGARPQGVPTLGDFVAARDPEINSAAFDAAYSQRIPNELY